MKTIEINNTVLCNEVKLIVKSDSDKLFYETCKNCYFYDENAKYNCRRTLDEFEQTGYCSSTFRNDNTNIWFEQVNNKENEA